MVRIRLGLIAGCHGVDKQLKCFASALSRLLLSLCTIRVDTTLSLLEELVSTNVFSADSTTFSMQLKVQSELFESSVLFQTLSSEDNAEEEKPLGLSIFTSVCESLRANLTSCHDSTPNNTWPAQSVRYMQLLTTFLAPEKPAKLRQWLGQLVCRLVLPSLFKCSLFTTVLPPRQHHHQLSQLHSLVLSFDGGGGAGEASLRAGSQQAAIELCRHLMTVPNGEQPTAGIDGGGTCANTYQRQLISMVAGTVERVIADKGTRLIGWWLLPLPSV